MEWLNDHAWAAWLGIAAVLGVAEMFSLDLIFLMLAVGALGGMVTGRWTPRSPRRSSSPSVRRSRPSPSSGPPWSPACTAGRR